MLRISAFAFMKELHLESQFSVSPYKYRLMFFQHLYLLNDHADQEKIINVVVFEFFN